MRKEDDILHRASQIRLLCLDVDGVLTDGAMYYDSNGESLKRFHTRDAAGLALLRAAGVIIALLSAENSTITAARARKLQIEHVVLGCEDKRRAADALRKTLKLRWQQVAYMGDDWFDLCLLEVVGLSACPADAHAKVRGVVTFRSRFDGGNGAVRELSDVLLESRDGLSVVSRQVK